VQHFFDRLDARLPDRETVAGSGFGIVDITAVVAVDVARVVRVRPASSTCTCAAGPRQWVAGRRRRTEAAGGPADGRCQCAFRRVVLHAPPAGRASPSYRGQHRSTSAVPTTIETCTP
jgi:hypothetical protein